MMGRFCRENLPWIALAAHIGALVFGLVGLLVMLPNPDLWSGDPNAVSVFDWSMEHAGATHIVFGALTMALFGWLAIGWAKTAAFLGVSYGVSLGFELLGTSTGWPFGNYAYTDFLGVKVLDHVPWTIPLSWFYMGLAAYLVGSWVARQLGHRKAIWGVLSGAWMLTAWDLVLDPAMAHESLRVKFWIWDEQGPYFGMPIKNFAGWVATGFVFMAISRWVWREDARLNMSDLRLPGIVFIANMIFAMAISAEVGLWIPIVLALVVAISPFAFLRYHSSVLLRRPGLSARQ